MLMILNNHKFKINLNRSPKNLQVEFVYFVSYFNKQNKLHIDEILDFSTFLINATLKLICAFSTSNVKITNYQSLL
jgi:hypothetical protein